MMTDGPDPGTDALDPRHAFDRRADWIRLHTLVLLRWIAIAGQVIAVLVATLILDLRLELGLVFATIGAAVVTNLMGLLVYPENKRLTELEVVTLLIFDMAQLTLLLSLTGGLHNPFALLILAQVAIAATALRLNSTMVVCAFGIVLVTLLLFFRIPLTTIEGEVMALPPIFVVGFWTAIVIGIVFQAGYARRVTVEVTAMGSALAATRMALSREQKLTDLGGVVAAAAHELGTPLATIALVAAELVEEAGDNDDLRADAQLIRDQAERCRQILAEMGRAGKQDRHIRVAPVSSVVEEAAEPHMDRGIEVRLDARARAETDSRQPSVERRPEMIHGLRNLVQNAVDFADATVWIDLRWSAETIALRIADDGPGYPADLLPRLGDPFMRNRDGRSPTDHERPAYEGMGLGLFIAKTLLERSGAELTFANGRDDFGPATPDRSRCGALVTVTWPRSRIAVQGDRAALGRNTTYDNPS